MGERHEGSVRKPCRYLGESFRGRRKSNYRGPGVGASEDQPGGPDGWSRGSEWGKRAGRGEAVEGEGGAQDRRPCRTF